MGKAKAKAGLENATQQPVRRSGGIAQMPLAGIGEVEEDKGPVTARGVPLNESEWDALRVIAQKHGGATVTSLLSALVRYGLQEAQAGRLKFKVKQRRNRDPQITDFITPDK